jgi:hypothetical protein
LFFLCWLGGVTALLFWKSGRFENFVVDGIRGPTFRLRLEASLIVPSVIAACMPLIVAGTTSYVEAQDICFERRSHIPARTDHQKTRRDDKGDIDYLYPMFYWMLAGTVISLVCLLLWLEKSPHKSSQHAKGKKLDTTLESFCLLQCASCVSFILFWEPSMCTRKCSGGEDFGLARHGSINWNIRCPATAFAAFKDYVYPPPPPPVIVTNILAHRYLVLRAEVNVRVPYPISLSLSLSLPPPPSCTNVTCFAHSHTL